MDYELMDISTLDFLPLDKRLGRTRTTIGVTSLDLVNDSLDPSGNCEPSSSSGICDDGIQEDVRLAMVQRRIIADQIERDQQEILNESAIKDGSNSTSELKGTEEKKAEEKGTEAETEAKLRFEQLRAEVWGPDYQRPLTTKKDRSFLQDGPCAEVAPKLNMCRECKMASIQKSKPKGIFCRFFAFRSLRLSSKGVLHSNGFLLPEQATDGDMIDFRPTRDVDVDAVKNPVDVAKRWNPETAVYILANVGDEFCKLKEQEKHARASLPEGTLVAWKKPVVGVREMCDVCETTLFNYHLVCHRCGFVVCIDCHRRRDAAGGAASLEDVKGDAAASDKDSFRWLLCSHNNRAHRSDHLVPTVIVPADCLERLCDQVHQMREKWQIRSRCVCVASAASTSASLINSNDNGACNKSEKDSSPSSSTPNSSSLYFVKKVAKNEALAEAVVHPLYRPSFDRLHGGQVVATDHSYGKPPKGTKRPPTPPASTSDLIEGAMIATPHLREDPSCQLFLLDGDGDAVLPVRNKKNKAGGGGDDEENSRSPSSSSTSSSSGSTLKDILARRSNGVGSAKRAHSPLDDGATNGDGVKMEDAPEAAPMSVAALTLKRARLNRPGRSPAVGSLDDLISSVVEQNSNPQSNEARVPLTRPLTYYVPRYTPCLDSPIRIHALTETSLIYPDVAHSWLCDGRLLCIHDPDNPQNAKLFQDQWKRGQPVLVCNVHKALTDGIWHPGAFREEFGHIKNDLVNCRNGHIMHALPMTEFWEGFANMGKRLVDQFQTPLVLKLKDWPPTEDFAELMPQRFGDLMRVLPMAAYTHRDGILNLAGRLPDFCVKPDLGPKMYNAYGMARYPQCGTTNLHLDMSDAVNVMVYIGKAGEEETIYKTIEDARVDVMTRRRLEAGREDGSALPGALWHIYDACDADAIRDLLNKVAQEIGETIEADHDPIHDQAWYLDAVLQDRLHKEYGVTGYAIVQCLGDSVFIPAGAPHQVLNLNSCIKAAEDFVSPEHLSHCFRLTQEFRYLSETHTNHEDKLQVKNIIYHTVKDAVSVLLHTNPDEDHLKSEK